MCRAVCAVRAVHSFFSNIENYKNLPSYQITDVDILHIRKAHRRASPRPGFLA